MIPSFVRMESRKNPTAQNSAPSSPGASYCYAAPTHVRKESLPAISNFQRPMLRAASPLPIPSPIRRNVLLPAQGQPPSEPSARHHPWTPGKPSAGCQGWLRSSRGRTRPCPSSTPKRLTDQMWPPTLIASAGPARERRRTPSAEAQKWLPLADGGR